MAVTSHIAARELDISQSTLALWRNRGRIKARRSVGGWHYYEWEDVQRLKKELASSQPATSKDVRMKKKKQKLTEELVLAAIDILKELVIHLQYSMDEYINTPRTKKHFVGCLHKKEPPTC